MNLSILQYLEKTAMKFPDKVAYQDTKESFSYSQLLDFAKRIGTYISGISKPRSPIVIYMDKRAYNIPAFWGTVYAGCFYVPIDSQMPAERINLIIETLRPSLILYDDVTEAHIGSIQANIKKIHYKETKNIEINQDKLTEIRMNSRSTDLLYVLFTSGSTGVPKGVTISHAAVIDFMEWICAKYSLDENTRLCNQAPFYFDASVPDLFIPFLTGATVFIPPKSHYSFPKKVLQYIIENNINTLIWVPSALCNVVNCKAFEVAVPSTIQLVIFCGEVMPCKHLNVWRKFIPDALYVNMYGPTEATYACMYYNIDREFKDDEKLPLGKACENSGIILLNEQDEPVKEGDIGEICILGQCLSQGYFNAHEKTKEVFVQNPINKNWIELLYRTGDLAYQEKQEFVFAGRKDFQVKRLGHRIELGEIENSILSVPVVENACCIFDPLHSDIIAIYTGLITEEKLSSTIEKKLPHYMLPTRYEHLNSMPMNLNGKIDRIKLSKDYLKGDK